MREEIVRATEEFVRRELMKMADFPNISVREAEYRIEHSFRVAHIAAEIARREGLDEERAYVAGILHDIGYAAQAYQTKEEYRNHGRIGAKTARSFLRQLGYSEAESEEICFGIAIHVDDKSDFEGERTPLALTVQDADNIDRFDAFRLYEGLTLVDYRNLPLAEQESHVAKMRSGLQKLRALPFGTETATQMWQETIDFQLAFYQRLQKQLATSR